MTRKVRIVSLIGIIVLVEAVFIIIALSVIESGRGGWDGRSTARILGKPALQATLNDIMKLSKADLMQLFYAAPAPRLEDMYGEYSVQPVTTGVIGYPSELFFNRFFGPGTWKSEVFYPLGLNLGHGYNVFENEDADTGTFSQEITRRMNTYIAPSPLDGRSSFHINYESIESVILRGLHDEIRMVNHRLFIGICYMPASGGVLNPMAFVLVRK